MIRQRYTRKLPLMIGALLGLGLLSAGASVAQTCRGAAVTVTLPAGGGSYDYSDNNRDVIWGSAGNDIVNMDICDAFCGNDGADDAIADDDVCVGSPTGQAEFDGGANGDDMHCHVNCLMIGGGGNDRMFVHSAHAATLFGEGGNDRFQINGVTGGTNDVFFYNAGESAGDNDVLDCNFLDNAEDGYIMTHSNWETILDSTSGSDCAD